MYEKVIKQRAARHFLVEVKQDMSLYYYLPIHIYLYIYIRGVSFLLSFRQLSSGLSAGERVPSVRLLEHVRVLDTPFNEQDYVVSPFVYDLRGQSSF